jgi:hypothetical protein
VNDNGNHQIVPGICITPSGQATVDPSLADLLFDLAIQLEEPTDLPVVLAARQGEIDPNTPLSSKDPALVNVLLPHVRNIFEQFGGQVGRDD